jgi:hypothetical protein
VQSYKIAVHLVKQTTDLGEITETWKIASEICDSVLKVMKSLKNSDPDCGTAQVYDLTLDYKNAAFKRYKLALEEREWEKKEIPAGLFPKTS